MLVRLVVATPEPGERRDCEQEAAAGLEAIAGCAEGIGFVCDVLENVEHEDEIERDIGDEFWPQCGNSDPVAPVQIVHDRGIGLDALNLSKLGQPVEEQTVAAADVEDAKRTVACLAVNPSDPLQDELFPRAPPPVSLPELAVSLSQAQAARPRRRGGALRAILTFCRAGGQRVMLAEYITKHNPAEPRIARGVRRVRLGSHNFSSDIVGRPRFVFIVPNPGSLRRMKGLAARLLPYLLAFFSSFCIMILELVASRLVARHVGASLNVWTSVIGIMLGGICLGNVLGGRLADRVEPSRAIGPYELMRDYSALTSELS